MKSLFLLCALALPAQSDRFSSLRAFFHLYPEKEWQVYMSDVGHPDGPGWEPVHWTWNGMKIWVRKTEASA